MHAVDHIHRFWGVLLLSLQDVLNNLGSSELDEDDLMLDMDLSDDQRHRHGNFSMVLSMRYDTMQSDIYFEIKHLFTFFLILVSLVDVAKISYRSCFFFFDISDL